MASVCDDIRGMAQSILNTANGEGISLCAILNTGAAVSLTFSASFEGSEEFTSTVRFTEEHAALFNSLKSSVPGFVVQLTRLLDAKRDALLSELRSRKNSAAEARAAAAERLASAQAEFQAAASAQRAAEEEVAAIACQEEKAEQLRMFPPPAAQQAAQQAAQKTAPAKKANKEDK
jgi:hypothetical protein